jgi:hypothetical protein
MRTITFAILILLLFASSVNAQQGKATDENPSKRYQLYFRPGFSDSLNLKLKGLTKITDSLKFKKYFNQKLNPYFLPRHYDQDDMVFNPGPSPERMPNAQVRVPGVYYTLKIFKSGTTEFKQKFSPFPFKQP